MEINSSSRPEERLLSAVIAFAIEEVCLKPVRITTNKNKKVVVMRHYAKTAYDFLFRGGSDGYCAALDIDPTEFKKRLISQLTDLSTPRPFDVSKRNMDAIGRRKRMFKLNHKLYHTGRVRGNFVEIKNRKEERKEYDDAE
jgi:hypothetical protein